MTYALEFRFDQVAEEAVRDLWISAGNFYGTDYLIKNKVIPHLALLVSDDELSPVLENLETTTRNIKLNKFDEFPGGAVKFLHPDFSDELVADHQKAHEIAANNSIHINKNYSLGKWVPHCTIAQNTTRNRKASMEIPYLKATITSLILVKYPPTTIITQKSIKAEQGSALQSTPRFESKL